MKRSGPAAVVRNRAVGPGFIGPVFVGFASTGSGGGCLSWIMVACLASTGEFCHQQPR